MNRYEEAYAAGYDCEVNGAYTTNCHFSHFATPGLTKEWERGRDAAKESRATRDAFEARTDRDLRNEPSTIDDFDATELQDSDSYKEFERKQEQSD